MVEAIVGVLGSLIVALLLDIRGDVKKLRRELEPLKAWAQARGFVREKWT